MPPSTSSFKRSISRRRTASRIARLARFHIAPDLAAGWLVPVLEAYDPGAADDVRAVYVSHARLSLRIRAFVDFLAAYATVDA
ncbi:hypothetical protein [Methylobacterium sp. P1-11]|uniref:hypothetical protein n=1 Tax=Methylobacterium sp. P1-11 TaxID=2024616 RepID=UPI0018D76C1A